MSCARYIDGSTLLCHDDELEGRRIAYILYLVPKDWKEEDGCVWRLMRFFLSLSLSALSS